MGFDQLVVEVARMRGGVAKALDALDLADPADQPAEAPDAAVRPLAVEGIDILAEQRDFDRALTREALRFRDDGGDAARILRPPGVGHDAEGAELVAALLDREEGLRPLRGAVVRQMVELRLSREVGRQRLAAGAGDARDQLRQLVIALRADDDVDIGRAAKNLAALGLGDAAGDGDGHVAARRLPLLLQEIEAAELGEGLLGRLLADMAGVEDDHVGRFRRLGRGIAERRQDIRHAGGVIDVHLAAIGADEQLLGQGFPGYPSRRL